MLWSIDGRDLISLFLLASQKLKFKRLSDILQKLQGLQKYVLYINQNLHCILISCCFFQFRLLGFLVGNLEATLNLPISRKFGW